MNTCLNSIKRFDENGQNGKLKLGVKVTYVGRGLNFDLVFFGCKLRKLKPISLFKESINRRCM